MVMWPSMTGPGWEQQLLLAAIMQCGIIAVLTLLWRAAGGSVPIEQDSVLTLSRRYERGDLTLQEFNRLRRAIPGRRLRTHTFREVSANHSRAASEPSWMLF
jgi:hypothetical protein